MVRVSKHLGMLKQNADVYTFVVKQWRSRAIVDTLLALRYSKQELARATPKANIEMVYQCGIVEEFENTCDARMAHAVWFKSTANRRQAQVKRPDYELQGIAHLKGLFVNGRCLLAPRRVVWCLPIGGAACLWRGCHVSRSPGCLGPDVRLHV